ncbi:MAG TPA: ROK family protein [Burkholderiales bacterium]|nr:ROK family protein [Burkholderiales bacterium]
MVDVGGSHVKCAATDRRRRAEFISGPKMTPRRMMKNLLKVTTGWRYDAVSLGYPGVVRNGKIVREPHNLGSGWIGFDFLAAFDRAVRIVNDAAMQALGGYEGGKMLFLGLGTGLGSTLIVDGVIAAMELGHLPYGHKRTYEDCVGEKARERIGNQKWRANVDDVVKSFREALLPDYIVLGGGNIAHLKRLPRQTRRGDNTNAIRGGIRLWIR